MHKKIRGAAAAALLLTQLPTAGLAAEAAPRFIVTLRTAAGLTAGASAQGQTVATAQASLQRRSGLQTLGEAGAGQLVLRGQPGQDAGALMQALAADPAVASVQIDRTVRRHAVPNDPRLSRGDSVGPAVGQWYLATPDAARPSAVDALRAWDLSKGGSPSAGLVVAVLDSGIRPDHPDLAGKLLPGYDFVNDPSLSIDGDGRDDDPSDPGDATVLGDPFGCGNAPSSWHGTQVAGLIGAATDNGLGMAGAGWHLRVLPLRVLGRCVGYQSDIVAAMRWAAGLDVAGLPPNPHPARVLNLSLGGEGACDRVYQAAIDEVRARGVVVVASVGNSNGRAVTAPANCAGVIAVGGLRHDGLKVGYSDVGPEISLSAPAGNCASDTGPCLYPISTTSDRGSTVPAGATYTGDGADASLGTSFATPLVAATAGLVLSVQPGLSPDQVRQVLQRSARSFPASSEPACRAPGAVDQLQCRCTTSTCGAGMLDMAAAVQRASTTSPGGGGGGGGGAPGRLGLFALALAVVAAARGARLRR